MRTARARKVVGVLLLGVTLTGCALVPVRSAGTAPTPIAVGVAAGVHDGPTATPAAISSGAPGATAPTQAPQPEIPATAPDEQEYADIGLVALAYLSAEGVDQPAVVGAAATAGDYAVALAGVFLEESGSRRIFLKHEANGWIVLYDSPQPTAEALAQRGIPASLGADFPIYGLHQALINDMNDPRGPFGDAYVVVKAVDQGFAKVIMTPEDRTNPATDILTLYYGPGPEGTYRGLTAGSSFSPEDLDQFGIPESVR